MLLELFGEQFLVFFDFHIKVPLNLPFDLLRPSANTISLLYRPLSLKIELQIRARSLPDFLRNRAASRPGLLDLSVPKKWRDRFVVMELLLLVYIAEKITASRAMEHHGCLINNVFLAHCYNSIFWLIPTGWLQIGHFISNFSTCIQSEMHS